MVATQSFSISRRTLDVEDYVDIIRRHIGWIVGPAFFGLVASIAVAFTLPNEYSSRATMEITPAEISGGIVQSTLANSLTERIQQMQQTILSRSSLLTIINDPRLNLYKEERKTTPDEDMVDTMRNAIGISYQSLPGKGASAFVITFNYKDRYKAHEVVSTLMNKFEEENQNTQKTDMDSVTGFVGDLLNNAKATLNDAEDKLTAFKQANAGKLPENEQLNIARENGFAEKIKNASEEIYRDQQQLANLETERSAQQGKIDFYDEQQSEAEALTLASGGGPGAQQNQELAKMDQAIENAEYAIQQMRQQYKDTHPALLSAQRQLGVLKNKREEVKKKVDTANAAAVEAAQNATKKPDLNKAAAQMQEQRVRHDVNDAMNRINAQEKLINYDIAKHKTEQDAWKKESDSTEQMLKESTGLEAQYEELNQAKKLADQQYQEYRQKQQLAEANSQLIQRKAGEVLEVLDPATLPVLPTKPNRFQYVGGGFAFSLILGLGLAGLQEARDTSLKNLKDVRAYTNLPVLCSIPLLENTMLVKRKRRLTYLAWSAAVLVGAAVVTASVVYYYTTTMHT
jgi:succinoglycan biosynthesis transport protein ExoP